MRSSVRWAAAAVAAVLGTTLSGCGAGGVARTGTPVPVTAQPVATPSVAAEDPQTYAGGPLEPGWYRTSMFVPAFAFRVGEGWRALFDDDADEFAMDMNGSEPFIAIARPAKVVDPMLSTATDAPDDLVDWFMDHPRLETTTFADRTSLAGMAVRAVEYTNPGTVDVPIFAFATGDFRVPAGVTQRSYIAVMDGADLVVTVGINPGAADEAALVAAVLDSLQLLPRD